MTELLKALALLSVSYFACVALMTLAVLGKGARR